MTQVIITIYTFISGYLIGKDLEFQETLKDKIVLFIYSSLFPVILTYYFLVILFHKSGIKDTLFFIRLLLGLISEEKESNFKVNIVKYPIKELVEKHTFLYKYLGRKVIKKYNL